MADEPVRAVRDDRGAILRAREGGEVLAQIEEPAEGQDEAADDQCGARDRRDEPGCARPGGSERTREHEQAEENELDEDPALPARAQVGGGGTSPAVRGGWSRQRWSHGATPYRGRGVPAGRACTPGRTAASSADARSPISDPRPPRGLNPDDAAALCCALLGWFEANGRDLAFRRTADPYAILVSEVMLQQTQIGRIEPAWRAFLERFPTVDALAGAAPADVLRQWGGLGYNRRAVNLHRAARVIVAEHNGRIPDRVEELERLPGIGPYTARAVAAIAFGVPVAPIDTNVRRVLGRVLAGAGAPGDPGNPLSDRELQALADGLADRERPAAWTHAVMDLGSAMCRRSLPACAACPLRPWCEYPRLAAAPSRAGPPLAGPSRARSSRAGSSRPGVPFEQTSRWLRGRIVASLRDAEPGAWVRPPRRLGAHDGPAVDRAVAALERDGLLERDGSGRVRLPID